MHVSLSLWNISAPDIVALGIAAERAGFHGIWLGEHVLAPVAMKSEHPTSGGTAHQHHEGRPIIAPDTELTDPLVALAGLATRTTTLQLATGVYVLPLRHPLAVARACMTLQDLAGGRFRLGIGAGWLEEEFHALGQTFARRGARMEEQLAILAAATSGRPFDHHGEHYDIDEVQLGPRAVPVPIVFGGSSPLALRRAATMAQGWFASGTPDVAEVAVHREEILRLRAEAGIDDPIHLAVRAPDREPATIEAYDAAGFDEVVLWADQLWVGDSIEERDQALLDAGAALGLVPRPTPGGLTS